MRWNEMCNKSSENPLWIHILAFSVLISLTSNHVTTLFPYLSDKPINTLAGSWNCVKGPKACSLTCNGRKYRDGAVCRNGEWRYRDIECCDELELPMIVGNTWKCNSKKCMMKCDNDAKPYSYMECVNGTWIEEGTKNFTCDL